MNVVVKTTVLILFGVIAYAQAPTPKDGFVPDEQTAIRIAEAVLAPIDGQRKLIRERPFHAELANGVWVVYPIVPAGMRGGGGSELRIDKKTGAILSHTYNR